jgi:hypothetical protein
MKRRDRGGGLPVALVVASTMMTAAVTSCGVAPQPDDVTTAPQALYGGGDSQFWQWDANNVPGYALWTFGEVPVCWNTELAFSYVNEKVRVREAVENSWGRVAGITFSGWATCTPSDTYGLRLNQASLCVGGNVNPGQLHTALVDVNLDLNAGPFQNRRLGVHEIGHALGFAHEHPRPDQWSSSGTYIGCMPGGATPGGTQVTGAGKYFSAYDADSVMNYCGTEGSHLSALDIIGARSAYGPRRRTSCQFMSDRYGTAAGGSAGFAPAHVQKKFKQMNCSTTPNSADTCQKISDLFGTTSSAGNGLISNVAKSYWTANSCRTRPLVSTPLCQRGAETWGIVQDAGVVLTWGSAPAEVRSLWTAQCTGQSGRVGARNPDACQHASDLYGISGAQGGSGTFCGPGDSSVITDAGWAPASVQTWFLDRGCRTTPVQTNRCQQLADLYGIRRGFTINWGFAGTDQKNYWNGHNCSAAMVSASSTNACQSASELYGISAGVTFGWAPADVQTWWNSHNCMTKASSGDVCQTAANNFGIVPGQGFASAPPDVQSWWNGRGCNARPVYDADAVRPVVRGDNDADLLSDIALTGASGWTSLPVAFSKGDGSFNITNMSVSDFPSWAAQANVTAVPGDFDGDGRNDIALTGGAGWTTVPVATALGDAKFDVTNSNGWSFATQASGAGVRPVPGDFNFDGRTDLALVGVAGATSLSVLLGNGDGEWAPVSFTADNSNFFTWARQTGARPVAGDFDGDGHDDIALVGGAGWGSIPVAFGNATCCGFTIQNVGLGTFPGLAATSGVTPVPGDFDGDGDTDIALVGLAGRSDIPIALSLGRTGFSFTTFSADDANLFVWPTTANVKPVAGDFDGDGIGDIALVGGLNWASVPVAFGRSGSTFHVTNFNNGAVLTTNNADVSWFATWAATAGAKPVGAY